MKFYLEETWQKVLKEELKQPYISELEKFLENEYSQYSIFPPEDLIFDAFRKTPFNKVNAVILGQDPYHKIEQARGLAFSVPKGIAIPPSLRNIYKALQNDFENFKIPTNGDLSPWADQGVLLLNTTMTVRENQAGSHQKHGWERFTDKVIQLLSDKKESIIFLLWGNSAKEKTKLIDTNKHHILTAVHPSPLSAHHGFLTCGHFSKTNELLKNQGKEPIDWQINS
jgi:uracil-DNA glycosylase